MKRGVLVGTDKATEWLLPWWWKRYSRHCTLPITFIDFGMSKKALRWCQKRGDTLPLHLDRSFIAPKEAVDPSKIAIWEGRYGPEMWDWRTSCFNKPFALALTPYEETVWLDLDCEILQPLEPIFQFIKDFDFSIAIPHGDGRHNSGVVVYRKNSHVLKKWIDICTNENAQFPADDYALTHLLKQEQLPTQLLPREWNWLTALGIHLFVKIFHWATAAGKEFIKSYGGIQDFVSRGVIKSVEAKRK